jgi:transmembrane sensor
MSETFPVDSVANSGAEKDRMSAAAWLERHVDKRLSEADQAEFEAWLAASPSHRIAYLRVETAWKRTYRLAALRSAGSGQDSGRLFPLLAKIAAGLCVLAVIGLAFTFANGGTKQRTYATGLGGHARLTLADGSHIELNTQTILRAPSTGMARTVQLEKGEAYFEIVHDASHPFTVVAGDRRIVDLGTKFLVRRDGERLQVSLIEGRARIDLGNGGVKTQSAILLPGDVVVASGDNFVVNRQAVADLNDEMSWRSGLLVFNHTTLAEAARQFNRYNRKQLLVTDPSIARSEIFGTFHANNIALFARVAEETFGLHVKDQGDSIVLAR